ncbi:MAG: 2Fe-2S iron-sulfur cluster binding domain-containing protein [Saprospiraceae bacterium]|nr:2Fe-2S iron-sulfur cluster binding domain-containing protein [Saprospiraceae bacterium]
MQFHSLKISKIVSETTDAKTIYFEIPDQVQSEYLYQAGQYLTIKCSINGTEIRRAYSISTPPHSKTIGVTVKKVPHGKMSVYLTEHIKEGDCLDVMTPEGHFKVVPDHLKSRDHYFIAAGSGITPVMSMIQHIVEEEPRSRCYLLYGSRNENSIIFNDQLEFLQKKYEDQIFVDHILSQPLERKTGGLSGVFGKKVIDWKGMKGRITTKTCKEFFLKHEPVNAEKHYYLCGPGDFIQKIESFLLEQHVDKKTIHKEFFLSASDAVTSDAGVSQANVQVRLKGETYDIVVPKGKTILDILVKEKKDPPYSCTSGAGSTCMAKVTEGEVTMDSCYALDDDEIAAGYILTCQSHPITQRVVLTYDM